VQPEAEHPSINALSLFHATHLLVYLVAAVDYEGTVWWRKSLEGRRERRRDIQFCAVESFLHADQKLGESRKVSANHESRGLITVSKQCLVQTQERVKRKSSLLSLDRLRLTAWKKKLRVFGVHPKEEEEILLSPGIKG